MKAILEKLGRLGWLETDSEEERLNKTLLVYFAGIIALLAIIWGGVYYYYAQYLAAFIPWLYALISSLSIIAFYINKKYEVFRLSQLLLSLILPFILMIALGGFKESSAVVIWSLTSPIGALVFKEKNEAVYWFMAYSLLLILGILLEPYIFKVSSIPPYVANIFYGLNIAGPTATSFVFLRYFVGEKKVSLSILEKKNAWINNVFSRYMSPNLVDYLIRNPSKLNLAVERRECTFIFTDLVNFTSLVEQSDPVKLVACLNEYFEGMTEIIFRHGGTLSKIVGDGICVMFSAPIIQPDHAERAVACVMELDAFAQRFSREMKNKGINLGHTRIGVNTGKVIIGNMGSRKHFDYRALGDAINIAARLESANKHLGTRVCISETTVKKCRNFVGRPIGNILLKGKSNGVNAFEPILETSEHRSSLKKYMDAFKTIEINTAKAIACFETIITNNPNDSLSRFQLNRLTSGQADSRIILHYK